MNNTQPTATADVAPTTLKKALLITSFIVVALFAITSITLFFLGESEHEIYISSLETRLEEIGTEWDTAHAFSKTNLEARDHYQSEYDLNIRTMEKLNSEANKIRELLGQDFQPSATSKN
jgi:fructose-1-phosphate kinase PfkB-like protein